MDYTCGLKAQGMYKVGVIYGKFLPPHRGHLNSIINSATRCEKLYVVVSDNSKKTKEICDEFGLKNMPVNLRAKWLSIELKDLSHISVVTLDETDIPTYPHGWEEWSKLLESVVPEKFDVIFGGEQEYSEGNQKYFPYAKYELYDYDRSRFPISATMIRSNPLKHWDYVLGSARGFFSKKVLVTGTESCGKSTMVKYLSKVFYTAWSDEVGRRYAGEYLGGNENFFTDDDFNAIAYLQHEQDLKAINSANKIVFFDTDAVVTDYYSRLYMGHENKDVQRFVNPNKYDLVLFLSPDVKWVADGQRRNSNNRDELDTTLREMYCNFGFDANKIKNVSGSYSERFDMAFKLCYNIIDS